MVLFQESGYEINIKYLAYKYLIVESNMLIL